MGYHSKGDKEVKLTRATRVKKIKRDKQNLEKYLDEISQFNTLPRDEEIRLARLVKQGNQQASDQLTKANLRFVISIAKEYQGQGLPLQDLISEGNFGLIKAAERFDEALGFKFISYAVWWIRQSILQALAEQSRVVRLPLNRVGDITRLGKELERKEKAAGRAIHFTELAQTTEEDKKISQTLISSSKQLSMDVSVCKVDDDLTLHDILPSDMFDAVDHSLISESLKQELNIVLRTLKPREAEIIKLYFGIDRDRPLTLEEIGEHFGLTRERVRQIKEKALRRLRHSSRAGRLQQYLG